MVTARKEKLTVNEWRKPDLAAFSMLFLVSLTFGMRFTFNQVATTRGVPFIPYVFLQGLGGAVILLLLCGLQKQLPIFSAKSIKFDLLTAFFSFSLPFCIVSLVAPKVPSGILSLSMMLIPLIVYGFALALGIDRFRWIRLFGLLLGLSGVLLVLLPKTSLPSADLAGWVAMGMLAPLCHAVGTVLMARLQSEKKSLPLGCRMLLASVITMVPVLAFTRTWWFFDGPFDIGHWAVIGATVNTAIIFVLVFEIIKRAGPVFLSTSNYIAPLFGVGLGMLFFGESHSLWIWAAVLLMLGGVFFVNRRDIRKPTASFKT
jgi:drug/metabolite transporter (DMT)-like permease